MSSSDSHLTALLTALLSEEALPPVDRWFSRLAKENRWSLGTQKALWDALRRALCRGFSLLDRPNEEHTEWRGFRRVMRGRAEEWTQAASGEAPTRPSLAEAGIPPWWKSDWDERVRRSSWTEDEQRRFLTAQETAAPVYAREHERTVLASQIPDAFSRAREGEIEIQDAASQISLAGLELRPGMRVWDVCAGRGGKTLLAASELRGKGAVLATDISEGRLNALKERVRRSGWQNIRILSWDGETPPAFGAELKQGFDRVVVDAPCTASGTWRRDPEGRYRVTPKSLAELIRHQTRLLRLGWTALKPGGRLAYVTCSWLPVENEDVVEAFVRESGAALIRQELLGLPAFDANTVYSAILEKPWSAT